MAEQRRRGQPNKRRRDDMGKRDDEQDLEVKALKEAKQDAEQRFRKILDRRNALNDEARQAREARDGINAERRRIYEEAQGLMARRNAIADQIKGFKATRGEAQGRARQLIGLKQEKRKGGATGGAGGKVRELEAQIKALEFKQQTVPMSGPKEQELLDELKDKTKELAEARRLKEEQDKIFGEIKDLDQAINEAFAKADEAHAEVVRLSNEWQEITDKLKPAFQELDHLKGEADRRHHESLELRKRANDEHQKATELRSEVMAARGEVDKVYAERRELVQSIKEQARALDTPEAREAHADEAVKALLEKGRIQL